MKSLKLILLALCLCLISGSALAAELAVKDGDAVIIDDAGVEHAVPGDPIGASAVDNSDMTFIALTEDDSARLTEFGIKPAIYFFNAEGRKVAQFAAEYTDICFAASLSPGKNVIALDSGTWVMRTWQFYSFPDFKPMGGEGVSYFSSGEGVDLIWIDDNQVLYNSLADMHEERKCGYDPCGATSVSIFELSSASIIPIREGTALCDYRLVSLENGATINSMEYCREKAEDWSEATEDPTGKPVTDEVPAG